MSELAPFCAQCGDSLVPLRVPHVSRACDQCDKTKHLVEPGEDGKGFRVDAGDSIHIPDGWLRFSLDPAQTNGRFSKAGTIWFVSHMLTGDLPRTPEDLGQYLSR